MASATYFTTLPEPSELSAKGLMAAPNAITTTMTVVVNNRTRKSSAVMCLQIIHGMMK